jgi:hypothetical protein
LMFILRNVAFTKEKLIKRYSKFKLFKEFLTYSTNTI